MTTPSRDGRHPRKPPARKPGDRIQKRTPSPRSARTPPKHLKARQPPVRHLAVVHALAPLRPIARRARQHFAPGQLERRTKTRVRGLLLISLLAFSGISIRLVQIQTLSAPHLRRLALNQRLHTIPLSAERGGVFDRNGSDLAISVTRDTIYADPKFVSDPGMYAAKIAPVVGISETGLYRKLLDGARRGGRYVVIGKTVDDAVAARVRNIVETDKLAGIGFLPESKRVYPS
ncbi:MAG: hypothetical protein QOF28_502, partial [Actinomycetota bacterium]|nr:hypothetical protein [Actinomycetota bacterium]